LSGQRCLYLSNENKNPILNLKYLKTTPDYIEYESPES
jgi:hypothetical protein